MQEWHYHDPFGNQCCARTDKAWSHKSNPADILPLRLQPKRWHQVLNDTRIAELFLATSNVNYGPRAQGSRAQRYAWTTQIHERFGQLRVDQTPVRIAATLVVWQTAARVLHEELFEAALKKANSSGDISGILEFSSLVSSLRTD